MLAVGFGIEDESEYVIVKNSMGTGWGELGYIRVMLKDDVIGVCGIYNNVIST